MFGPSNLAIQTKPEHNNNKPDQTRPDQTRPDQHEIVVKQA